MTPNEALEWAADYAERYKIFEAPKNDRGYIKDNWKEPTPAERVSVIKDLAATVVKHPVLSVNETARLEELKRTVKWAVKELSDAENEDPWMFVSAQVKRVLNTLDELTEKF